MTAAWQHIRGHFALSLLCLLMFVSYKTTVAFFLWLSFHKELLRDKPLLPNTATTTSTTSEKQAAALCFQHSMSSRLAQHVFSSR